MKKNHYAVVRGFHPGIYDRWFGPGGAEEQVRGYANALFKGFGSRQEAELWQKRGGPSAGEGLANKPAGAGKSRGHIAAETGKAADSVDYSPSSDETSPSRKTIIYTDGGCKSNPGPGGYGAVVLDGTSRRELAQGFRLTTNNRMELMSCIAALQSLTERTAVVLHSDSRYVVNGIEKGWAKKWRAKGWMRTKEEAALNADLWSALLELCDRHQVQFLWVRGHAGTRENERCDRLATQAALGRDLLEDTGYLRPGQRPAE